MCYIDVFENRSAKLLMLAIYRSLNTVPYCFNVYLYEMCPQTLAEACRHGGSRGVLQVAIREIYPQHIEAKTKWTPFCS